MTLLSIIEKLNKKSINPDMDGLLEHANLFESHLEYIITSLLEKGYIDKESNSKLYDTYDYIATEKGKDLLVQYRIQVKNLITSIMQLYQNNEKEELRNRIKENRDSLWFAYYEGFITKKGLQDIADLLDENMQRIWWDESFQKWMDRNWGAIGPGTC